MLKKLIIKYLFHKIIVVLSSLKRLTEVYPTIGWLESKTKSHLHSMTKTWNHVLQLHGMCFFFITLTIKPLTPLLKYKCPYKQQTGHLGLFDLIFFV